MKRKFGCGIAALVLLLALGISGCPTEPGEEEKEKEKEEGSPLSKISFVNIPGSDAETEQVTFICVTATNADNDEDQAMGLAVVDGTMPGVNGAVPAIETDGTAEVELYDAAEFLVFLAAIKGELNPVMPHMKKTVRNVNEISVTYSTVADGDADPSKVHTWTGAFKDPQEINWDNVVVPNTEEKVLIVTNIPPKEELVDGKAILGVGIVTSLDDPDDNTLRVAGGIASTSPTPTTFALAEMVSGLPFGPKWKGNGSHYIVLGTGISGGPPNYVYTAGTDFGVDGGGAKKYDFNKAASTIDWSQFREQPVAP